MSKDICSKCGFPWVSHDFGVPEPYCPTIEKSPLDRKEVRKMLNYIEKEIKKCTENFTFDLPE